jgi:uncharacterized protein YutE (UPF0331/DUF86 family)
MTVDADLLAARVAKIREQLRHLTRLNTLDRDAFLAAPIEQHAAERELAVAVEACLDIGHHVIAREGFRRPRDYRDVFRILREQRVIDSDLGERLEEMASFRNRLVHGYVDVDPGRVYDIARTELPDIEAFVAALVNRYIPGASRQAAPDSGPSRV